MVESVETADVPLLELSDVVKQFGGTIAVNHVSLTLRAGRALALLGQNGAGKSTVIKMLAGVHSPDAGEIRFGGQRLDGSGRRRIAFIHQDLGLIDSMTAAENIALVHGYPRKPGGIISWRGTEREADEVLRFVGLDVDADVVTKDLSRTEKSLLAIARALAMHSEMLVLDEPTASLPSADVERLLNVLLELKHHGVAIIYVTHRLDEIFHVADQIAVMRDGFLVGDRDASRTTPQELIELIVGKRPAEVSAVAPPAAGKPVLELQDVRVSGATEVGPVSLTVAAGELVGLAGLRGSGHEALGRALCGLRPLAGGAAYLNGVRLAPKSPRATIDAGVAFLTSNRQEESLAMTLTVTENLFMNPAVRGRKLFELVTKAHERHSAAKLIDAFSIRPPVTDHPVAQLSGGNQQKVVLAKWLGTGASLLVLEEPTMGVDVGAKAEIYALMNDALASGVAIAVISTDFEEVARVCNRAFVFNRGRIVAELDRARLSPATLVHYAADRLTSDDALVSVSEHRRRPMLNAE